MRASKILAALERQILSGRSQARMQSLWEARWSREDLDKPWMNRPISKQLVEAVDTGWFPRGGRVLDVGCGEGDVTQWLSEHSFPTLGIDFAESAIRRARNRYGEVAGEREFQVLDIVRQAPPDHRYAAVVDRGCFHAIKSNDSGRYVRNIASVCPPEARLLLFISAFRGKTQLGQTEERALLDHSIERAFAGHFEIIRSEEADLGRSCDLDGEPELPGLVYWMSRQ